MTSLLMVRSPLISSTPGDLRPGQGLRPPPSVPVTLVHGTDDNRVPIGMSQVFKSVGSFEIPGGGHSGLIDPQSLVWPRVLAAFTGHR